MQSLVVYFTHLSLVLSVRYRLITASTTLQARGEMCTRCVPFRRANSVIMLSISVADPGEGTGTPPPPYLSTKMRPEGQKTFFGGDPSPPPTLSEGLDPPLNINYVLVLVYMRNCKRAQSLVCHGPS